MIITAIGMGADTLDKFTKKAPTEELKTKDDE